MAFVKTDAQHYSDICAAIREKNGLTTRYKPSQMAAAISAISGKETLSWHQCPEAVRNYLAYLAENPYSETDYTTTAILDFAPNPPDQANTKPVGYTIDGVTFRDNEPLVATPFSTTNRAGTLTALDRLRWYNTTEGNASGNAYPRGRNCRDLGGWDCDGGMVRYGLLVRAGELNPVDKELMVDRVGIKTEICLLPTSEQLPESLWGIDRVVNPQELDFQYQTSSEYYKQWKLYLTAALNSVVRGKPVIFHCGAGADKTGTLAVMLMGILGCSQSDIDADFELTMFAWGTQTWRNRTYNSYRGYINKIKAIPLVGGLADTFRNHCISFALSLGITVEEINAFRTAMIDGTPEMIMPSISTYTVVKTLSHVSADNADNGVTQYQPYEANLRPDDGYAISDVIVTMGGSDITSSVFSGTKTIMRRSVANVLTNCSTNNNKRSVVDDEGYVATITADSGYTLDGATVQITMGGVDVSAFYSDGKIAIPNVTGNLVISVSAVPSAPAFTNWLKQATAEIGGSTLYNGTGYKDGYRLNSTGLEKNDQTGSFITGYIPVQDGDTVHFYGDIWSGVSGGWYTMCYAADGSIVEKTNPYDFATAGQVSPNRFTPYDYDSANHVLHSFTIPSNKNIVAIRFTLAGSYVEGTSIITINEEAS